MKTTSLRQVAYAYAGETQPWIKLYKLRGALASLSISQHLSACQLQSLPEILRRTDGGVSKLRVSTTSRKKGSRAARERVLARLTRVLWRHVHERHECLLQPPADSAKTKEFLPTRATALLDMLTRTKTA